MKQTACLLFCLQACFAFAQTDSLKKCLAAAPAEKKIELLNQLIRLDSTASFRDYHQQALLLAEERNDFAAGVHTECAMGAHFLNARQDDSALYYYTRGLVLARVKNLLHEQVTCLDQLGVIYRDEGSYPKAMSFFNSALLISKKSGNLTDERNTVEETGIWYLNQRKYKQAIEHFNTELKLSALLHDSSSLAATFNNIGTAYYYQSQYDSCIVYYKKALQIKKDLGEKLDVANAYVNIGIIYKNKGSFNEALGNLLEGLRGLEKEKNSQDLASCYNTLGLVYLELGNPKKALFYHLQAWSIRDKIGYKKGIAGSKTNIGEAYLEQGNYTLAKDFLEQSIELKKELGDSAGLASSLDLMGKLYFLQQDNALAENYYLHSLKLEREASDRKGTAITLNHLAELYLAWKKYDEALANLKEGRQLAVKIGAKNILLDNYGITIKVLRAKGKDKEALAFYDLYASLKDELLGEQKAKDLSELQIKYNTEKQQQQITLLGEKEKSQAAVVSRQNTLIISLIAGSLLLVLIILISLQAYRSGRKAYRQSQVIIEQKQAMLMQKQTVMRELHHRIKNNLQVLSSLLHLQRARLKDANTKEAIKAIENRLNAMQLIHQELYGEEVDTVVNLQDYIRRLADHLLYSFAQPPGMIKFELPLIPLSVEADKALTIGFICNEIISNAFKHAFENVAHPELQIRLLFEKGEMHLAISDNGTGMPAGTDPEHAGSFGLRLIHMLVKDLSGTIHIETGTGGSTFEFIIPLNSQKS